MTLFFTQKSLRSKFMIILGALIGVSLVGSFFAYKTIVTLEKKIKSLVEVHMTSSEKVLQSDMAHDQLRAIAFRALIGAQTGSHSEIEASREEFKEAKEAFEGGISTIRELPVSESIHADIARVQPRLNLYLSSIDSMITMAERGEKAKMVEAIPAFSTLFEELADEMAKLEEHISDEAKQSREESEHQVSFAERIIGGSIFILVFVGFISIVITQKTIVNPLDECMHAIEGVAQNVSSASNQIEAASKHLAEGASEQAAGLEETSASMEEISSMVSQSAENAGVSKEISIKAKDASEKGMAYVRDMSETINGIRISANQMKEAVSSMQTAEKQIAKIVKDIDEIAFQTNILALNAAVEAARAGEAGAGFAVVADEVRNLAQRSAQAARETAQKIDESIQISHRSVEASDRVHQSLALIDETTKRVESGFDEILMQTRNVSSSVAQIAKATEEQATGVKQTRNSLTQIDQITQANAAQAEETSQAAHGLIEQVQGLEDALRHLKILVDGADTRVTTSVKVLGPGRTF
jgi:methyl-accepting chemotaxis protein